MCDFWVPRLCMHKIGSLQKRSNNARFPSMRMSENYNRKWIFSLGRSPCLWGSGPSKIWFGCCHHGMERSTCDWAKKHWHSVLFSCWMFEASFGYVHKQTSAVLRLRFWKLETLSLLQFFWRFWAQTTCARVTFFAVCTATITTTTSTNANTTATATTTTTARTRATATIAATAATAATATVATIATATTTATTTTIWFLTLLIRKRGFVLICFNSKID